MIIEEKFFSKVPKHQYILLKNFIEEHPYKKYVKNGVEYEYIATGNGKRTIVLLHGAMFNPYMWFYIIDKFKNDYYIIAPKLPLNGFCRNNWNSLYCL